MIHTLRMSTRWWTFGVWAAVAASALYWGFRLFAAAPLLPREAEWVEMGSGAARGDFTRLLGAEASPAPPAEVEAPVADARLQLFGVVSPRSAQAAREGLALIAVDGKPPKAFRVGAVVEGQNVLQAVGVRSARLGPRDGAARVVLSLTPPAPAATGMPPAPGMTHNLGSIALVAGGKPQSLAPAQRSDFQSQQQLFHQRQQMQFQQEEMQNQGPYTENPPPLPKVDPPAGPGNLR